MDPDWSYPDPDPTNLINPDPGRIQVNEITKFSKHLLIFKSKKNRYELSEEVGVSKHQHLLFLRFRLKKYNFLRKKKDFCWLNSAFPFILSVILYLWIRIRIHKPKWIRIQPDPDPHHCFSYLPFILFPWNSMCSASVLNIIIFFFWMKKTKFYLYKIVKHFKFI